MKAVALGLAVALACGGTALAAERSGIPAPHCSPLAAMRADPELKSVKFSALTPGQFHFIEGVYAASPVTPSGPPPGDGALLFKLNGKSMIVWTRGKNVCMSVIVIAQGEDGQPPRGAYMPMPLSDDVAKLLEAVKTGKEETAGAGGTDPDELHL